MKILLGTHNLTIYSGSELVILDIAVTLKKLGHQVTVGTFNTTNSLVKLFKQAGIPVFNLLEQDLENKKCDLVWAQHFPVIETLVFQQQINAPKIIFSSLSPFEPLESLPSFHRDLSLILTNSDETKTALLKQGGTSELIKVFPNFVTTNDLMLFNKKEWSPNLTKLLVVTNHLATEVKTAVESLRLRGLTVDIVGLHHHQCLVNAKLLLQYQAVMTIGRTAQLAFAVGVPVYCYDIFGGPGYIDQKENSLSASHNYSGRPYTKKTAAMIVDEIVDGYQLAVSKRAFFHKYVTDNCHLEQNLIQILEIVTKKKQPVNLALIKNRDLLNTQHHRRYLVLLREMKLLQEKNNHLAKEQAAFAKSVWYKIWWHTKKF